MKRRILLALAPLTALLSWLGLRDEELEEQPFIRYDDDLIIWIDNGYGCGGAELHVDIIDAGTANQRWHYTLYRPLDDGCFMRIDMLSTEFMSCDDAARRMNAEIDEQVPKLIVQARCAEVGLRRRS